jgi:DNA-binding response OmpR family regulator
MTLRNEIGDEMSNRKTHFEVIKQTEIAFLLQAEVAPLLEDSPPRILSLTYDPSLARTRELLFTGAGFQVSTYRDVAKAIAACKNDSFDLVVVGHSISLEERESLVKEVRTHCGTPVLALVRHGEARLLQADHFFDSSESPALLLETVIKILRRKEAQN